MTESPHDQNVTPVDESVQSSANRVASAMATLKTTGDGGASWYFWIAGLSLVNTALIHCGGNVHFIVGLGITTLVDLFAAEIGQQNPEAATIVTVIAVGFSIFVAAISFLFGWLSRKRILWIYGIGMVLYLLDGLLYLLIGDFLSAAFHGYALYSMYQGFSAYRKLSQLEAALQNSASEPEDAPIHDASHDPGFETAEVEGRMNRT